jgi:hypothetical protein
MYTISTPTPQPGTIGDFVWDDRNRDGVQDVGEPGLSGVLVQLLDGAGNLIDSTSTDATGYYAFTGVSAGTYIVAFGSRTGYDFSPQNQGGDDAVDSDADRANGRTASFAFAAGETRLDLDAGMYRPGGGGSDQYLTLIKTVINDDGGTATVADFPLYVDGGRVTSGQRERVTTGTHQATEDTLEGYTASLWGGDCAGNGSVDVRADDSLVCTITNDDIAAGQEARLTLIKTVINDDGGTATVADFDLFINATGVTSGVARVVGPGTYTANETELADYDASSWGGDCAADGTVTLVAGDDKTCTITNDDLPPPPPPPPIPLALAVAIDDEVCGVTYETGTIDFTGLVTTPAGGIDRLEYSITGGQTWRGIETVPALELGGGPFTFNVFQLPDGEYTVTARAVTPAGAVLESDDCDFRVGGDLIFGANEFVLPAQRSPISDYGIIQLYLDEPHQFYLEAIGARRADVVNLDTGEEYELTYDRALKLWTGMLVFDEEGQFRLQGSISNEFGSYRREINSVSVIEPASIRDAETAERIEEAIVTVMEADPATGLFREWNGVPYGQENPFIAEDGRFGLILPQGEFYLRVSVPGYDDISSVITTIERQSRVTADIQMERQTLFDYVVSFFLRDASSNNFPLRIVPLEPHYLLEVGEPTEDITLERLDGEPVQLRSLMRTGVPTVIYAYSNWNTLAQEQMRIYEGVVEDLGRNYILVPITTMEPLTHTDKFLGRGDYRIVHYRPTDIYHHNYFSISLPQFFLLDGDGNLVDIIVGPQTAETLTRRFSEAFGPQ